MSPPTYVYVSLVDHTFHEPVLELRNPNGLAAKCGAEVSKIVKDKNGYRECFKCYRRKADAVA